MEKDLFGMWMTLSRKKEACGHRHVLFALSSISCEVSCFAPSHAHCHEVLPIAGPEAMGPVVVDRHLLTVSQKTSSRCFLFFYRYFVRANANASNHFPVKGLGKVELHDPQQTPLSSWYKGQWSKSVKS